MNKLYFTIIMTLVFLSLTGNAEISTRRIAEIKAKACSVESTDIQKIFKKIDFDYKFQGAAASRKMNDSINYELVINPAIMNSFTESGQMLIVYHELGHYYLGHLDQPYFDDVEYRSTIEFEADTFSAYLYKKNGLSLNGLRLFISTMEFQTDSIPSGVERAKIYKNILFGDQY